MVLKRTTAGLILRANTFFSMQRNENGRQFLFGSPKVFAPRFFSPLFGERKESPRRQKKAAAHVGADDSVRPYRATISPQISVKPFLPTAGRTESSAPTGAV